ncbi:hypothetical protein OSTOST_12493, partial [Ostertagia ostertagi]
MELRGVLHRPRDFIRQKRGNWTFRDRKQSRPSMDHDCMRRDDRPMSMNLSESRGGRSKSETAPRQVEVRVPVKIERAPPADEYRRTRQLSETAAVYKSTRGDISRNNNLLMIRLYSTGAVLVEERTTAEHNSNPLRKSCPDLDAAAAAVLSTDERGARRRNRRAKEKIKEASWKRKPVEV